jgi:1,4-alpha-glucan branching enzyme
VPAVTSAFCLVLHAHQPYVRRHGAWPCGEDWFHQAASDAYLPLAETFAGLARDGLSGLATVSISPVLAGQMADPYMTRELLLFEGRTMLRAQRQAANARGPDRETLVALAAEYHVRAADRASKLEGAWSSGVHVPWRDLAADGVVELWTSAPTHAFLPELRDPGFVAAGFRAAVAEHARVFGAEPGGAWLPECAYAPPRDGDPGIEDALADAGLPAFVVDGPAFEVAGATIRRPALVGSSDVAALARDRDVSLMVSGPGAYPGAGAYRDFHHVDGEAGFKSFAVTGPSGPKRVYDPDAGMALAADHGRAYAEVIRASLARSRAETGREGILVAAFDLELFGHWWYEGPAFLSALLRTLAAGDSGVRPMTLGAALEAFPPEEKIALGPTSWGRGGDFSSWRNAANEPMWRRVWSGEAELRRVLAADGDRRARAQAVRELLLLSASDWPYMVTMGRAADYARDRADGHDRALRSLCDALARGESAPDPTELEELDNVLPLLDPDDFARLP